MSWMGPVPSTVPWTRVSGSSRLPPMTNSAAALKQSPVAVVIRWSAAGFRPRPASKPAGQHQRAKAVERVATTEPDDGKHERSDANPQRGPEQKHQPGRRVRFVVGDVAPNAANLLCSGHGSSVVVVVTAPTTTM